jgi:hypothetical protein
VFSKVSGSEEVLLLSSIDTLFFPSETLSYSSAENFGSIMT